VQEIVRRVPDGMSVQYAQLAFLAGVPISYCRVFPRLLAELPGGLQRRAVPWHDHRDLPRWSGDEVFEDEQGLGS
jgi:alkylated DNA nucleotide flippase Atl1